MDETNFVRELSEFYKHLANLNKVHGITGTSYYSLLFNGGYYINPYLLNNEICHVSGSFGFPVNYKSALLGTLKNYINFIDHDQNYQFAGLFISDRRSTNVPPLTYITITHRSKDTIKKTLQLIEYINSHSTLDLIDCVETNHIYFCTQEEYLNNTEYINEEWNYDFIPFLHETTGLRTKRAISNY